MHASIGFEGEDVHELEDGDLDTSQLDELDPRTMPHEDVRRVVDSLDLKAEWKIRLDKLVRLTVRVGGRVVRIGMRILEVILETMKKYPMTSAALIVGGVLTLLAAHVPVLGLLLAPLVAAVTVATATFTFAAEQALRIKEQFRAFAQA